jgi:hypothetical protein
MSENELAVPQPLIPLFEGAAVEATRLKIANSAVLDLPDEVLHVDDVIQILVEARVTQVSHTIHEASGKMIRQQVAKPYRVTLIPFNPNYDTGVDRA